MAGSVPLCINFQNTAKKRETSTGKSHRYIPSVPQEFDCRVKANINPESLNKDLKLKDEEFKTTYFIGYPRKIVLPEQWYRPPRYYNMQYLRTVEEKLLVNPPPPMVSELSEMKDSFRRIYTNPSVPQTKAPAEASRCYISKLGCEQQPSIPPNRKGFWRWTDPYLTSNRSDYVPYDCEVDDAISDKILTYYNKSEFELPAASGNKTMFDRRVFKNVLPIRLMSRSQKRIPNFGMQTEYQDHYIKQTFSALHPHLEDRCTVFEDSLAPASRWQNLPPPGMYCSEYCNIGGSSVRRIIDQETPTKGIIPKEKCGPLKAAKTKN